MSSSAPFLGKMFICRDGRPYDRYALDGINGTHTLFNVYANGRNEPGGFTGVAVQGVEPVTGPGKPSDLKHLTRGPTRDGEVAPYYRPLVIGADSDTRTFGINFSGKPPVLESRYLPGLMIPYTTAGEAKMMEMMRQRNPAGYQKFAEDYWGSFACRSASVVTGYRFGTIYWWWGVGWFTGYVAAFYVKMTSLTTNVCGVYSSTPSAADWRTGRRLQPLFQPSLDYQWCDLSGEDYSHLSFRSDHYPGYPKEPARFANADLTGTDFTGSSLANADFRGVHSLKHAKFVNAVLDGANLSGVDLEGVDFSGASLLGADLSDTDVTRAIFNTAAKLSHDINRRTRFAHSKVPWSVLYDPARDGDTPNLTALDISYATLVGVPQVVHDLDASNADVRGIDLSNRDLLSAKFDHARAEGIHLSGCRLDGASFQYAFLGSDGGRAASFDNANLMNANFFNADLTGSIFSAAYLWGSSASLQNATLVQTAFNDAYLAGADFSGIANKQCSGVNFSGSCLVNAKFNGTTTQKYMSQQTNFVDACLQGADFSGATLVDTTLSDATVSFEHGTFPASVPMRWPPKMVALTPLTYDATAGLQNATHASTTCPSSADGPCTDATLHNRNPVTKWPRGA